MHQESPVPNVPNIDSYLRIENHYPPSYSNTFADTLYNNRRDNDLDLEKIIQLTLENKQLQDSIEEYKNIVPPFLLEWWNSQSGGEEKLTTFLEGLISSIHSEIDIFNSKMCLHQGQQEVNEADHQQQLRIQSYLRSDLCDLEAKLQDLKRSNSKLDQQINQLKQIRPTIQEQYLQRIKVSSLINGQNQYQHYQRDLVESFFSNQPYIVNKQQQYYQTHASFLASMSSRRQYLQGKLEELKSTVEALDEKIEGYLQEKREKQQLKQKIVEMHQMVNAKKKQLKQYQEKTQIAENKMKDLQRKICDENMEKAIEGYDTLSRKYHKLTERTLHLLGKSLIAPNLQNIERIVRKE